MQQNDEKKIIIFIFLNIILFTETFVVVPINSTIERRRAPILNDALTSNETLAAGRNAFLMSHLFERINNNFTKNVVQKQKQNLIINETKGNEEELIFKDCSQQWIKPINNNFEKKILNENNNNNTFIIFGTTEKTEINSSFFDDNNNNEATNPFIFPPTELAILNKQQIVDYPKWLKIVFFCVIGFGITFFLLMLLFGLITRCENATTTTNNNIEENNNVEIVEEEEEQIINRPSGRSNGEQQQKITTKYSSSEETKAISSLKNNNNRIIPIKSNNSGSIVVVQQKQPITTATSSSSKNNYPAKNLIFSSPPGFVVN